MSNVECRTNDEARSQRSHVCLFVILISTFRRHSSFGPSILEPGHCPCLTTSFGFSDSYGNATHLVWPVGFQDWYAGRKSSADRSVTNESCFRRSQGRNRCAQARRFYPDHAWTFRSRRKCRGDREKDTCKTRSDIRSIDRDC